MKIEIIVIFFLGSSIISLVQTQTVISENLRPSADNDDLCVAPWHALTNQSQRNENNSKEWQQYRNPELGFNLRYPTSWSNMTNSNSLFSISPDSNGTILPVVLSIYSIPSDCFNFANLGDLVSQTINSLKLGGWNILGVTKTEIQDTPALAAIYTNNSEIHRAAYALKDDRFYHIIYQSAGYDHYSKFLPDALRILKTVELTYHNEVKDVVMPGLETQNYPQGIFINSEKGMLYVANYGSNTVSSIGLTKNLPAGTTTVGSKPHQVAVIPSDNMIYVTNFGNDSISVIDGITGSKIRDIKVGKTPLFIASDPDLNQGYVFVANRDSNNVSVIADEKSEKIKDIQVGLKPYGIDVNPVTNKAYVANAGSNTITVIDYLIKGPTTSDLEFRQVNISVGHTPQGVAVDTSKNLIYVTNAGSNDISIVNGSDNKVIRNFTGVFKPWFIDVNPETHMLFVTSEFSKTLSIINGSTGVITKTIKFNDGRPRDVHVDAKTNIVYVTNDLMNKVHVINGSSGSGMVQVDFSSNITDAGKIVCGKDSLESNARKMYDINTAITCRATANIGYTFSYWSGSLAINASSTPTIDLNLTKHGTLRANYVTTNDPLLAFVKEQWTVIYFVITGLVLSPIAGYIIHYALQGVEKRRQLKYLKAYLQLIDKTLEENLLDKQQCKNRLNEKRNDIVVLLKEGIISDSTYNLLKGRIADLSSQP